MPQILTKVENSIDESGVVYLHLTLLSLDSTVTQFSDLLGKSVIVNEENDDHIVRFCLMSALGYRDRERLEKLKYKLEEKTVKEPEIIKREINNSIDEVEP